VSVDGHCYVLPSRSWCWRRRTRSSSRDVFLPENQLDAFSCGSGGYPEADEERAILAREPGDSVLERSSRWRAEQITACSSRCGRCRSTRAGELPDGDRAGNAEPPGPAGGGVAAAALALQRVAKASRCWPTAATACRRRQELRQGGVQPPDHLQEVRPRAHPAELRHIMEQILDQVPVPG